MESVTVEFPRHHEPAWLQDIVDEFTEDPYCHLVMVGADDDGVVLTTMWAAEVARDVATALAAMDSAVAVRRMVLSIPTVEAPAL
jgi:hypothetical protein